MLLHEILTDDVWECFADGWKENGFDVYWKREPAYVNQVEQELNQSQLRSLNFNEEYELGRSIFFEYQPEKQIVYMERFRQFLDSVANL